MIPKGSRLKQNLPYGVINVVRRADSLESFTCQNPTLASSLEIWLNLQVFVLPMVKYAFLNLRCCLISSNRYKYEYYRWVWARPPYPHTNL